MKTLFYKYQGAGNDFLIADNRDGHIVEKEGVLIVSMPDGSAEKIAISQLCDRRYGVGADGVMLLERGSDSLDFRMAYFNSDGSGGMMCGNGGRCIVAFAADKGVIPSGENDTYIFDAADGLHTAQVTEAENGSKIVCLKMKDVSEYHHYDRLEGMNFSSDGSFLDTGTRHYVRIVKGVENYDIVSEGRYIRYNATEFLPIGVNVNFVEPLDSLLKIRTYEKGVEDETYACGTGIVASCIASYMAGIKPSAVDGKRVIYNVKAKRDELSVSFTPSGSVYCVAEDVCLIGPATYVAEINIVIND
jgi:diaminopimelate epimerase